MFLVNKDNIYYNKTCKSVVQINHPYKRVQLYKEPSVVITKWLQLKLSSNESATLITLSSMKLSWKPWSDNDFYFSQQSWQKSDRNIYWIPLKVLSIISSSGFSSYQLARQKRFSFRSQGRQQLQLVQKVTGRVSVESHNWWGLCDDGYNLVCFKSAPTRTFA